MATIYRIFIETENGEDWIEAREIFDGENSPMTTPYRYEVNEINAWSRKVEVNRDENWIENNSTNKEE